MAKTNQALQEAGLEFKNENLIRYMVEVLIKDVGYEEIAKK